MLDRRPWGGRSLDRRDHSLAMWTEGGWRFVTPGPGMRVWNKASGYWNHWNEGSCSGGEVPAAHLRVSGQQVVGSR